MDSDFSDDGRSRHSRNTSGRKAPWVPNGRFNGTSTTLPSSTAAGNPSIVTVQDPNTQSVGLLDPALSNARRRKLDAINKLHSLGAERDLDIPQIVVIGSQSAGKSSLIESISGITLPRASGTCTRCPTECRMAHSSEPWQCAVSLRFTTDAAGNALGTVKNPRFGIPIRDRKQVEDRIRRAQRAILNPNIDPERFLEDRQVPENNALAFSANCVCLEITGQDVTDLSFIDLPGLINSVADDGRDGDVEEVKELVTSYIKRSSCIILLTVACESDFETQGAYRLAKQFDKKGARTIGVLTKPDRIPEGEEGRWIRLIKNEASPLQNGWYSVKQPSSKELQDGLSFQEARRRGEDFFTLPPWSKLEAVHKRRLGTQALTLKLNEFLMSVISKRIPEILQELQTMLQQTSDELQKLPERGSQDPMMELMHLISDFSDRIHRQAEGFSHDASTNLKCEGSLFQPIAKAQTTFRHNIRATAPNFRPFNNTETRDRTVIVSGISGGRGYDAYEPAFLETEEGEKTHVLGEVIYRREVMQRVQNAKTRELPGYYPFHVIQDLVSLSTDNWTTPALSLIETIHQVVVENQNQLIEDCFARYTEGGLSPSVSNIMHRYMLERREKSTARVKWLLELEAHVFTTNESYFNDYRAKFLNFYRYGDHPSPVESVGEHIVGRPDPSQEALEIMATARAYFHVAYKRVVDTIPLAVDRELVRIDKKEVLKALSFGLSIMGPDGRERCQRLLAEPAEVVSLRDELEHRLERLEAAQKELLSV